jgi:hypothetical protein
MNFERHKKTINKLEDGDLFLPINTPTHWHHYFRDKYDLISTKYIKQTEEEAFINYGIKVTNNYGLNRIDEHAYHEYSDGAVLIVCRIFDYFL